MTAGFLAGGVQRVNDGVENAAAIIAPSRCMKGYRKLPVAVLVHGGDAVHEFGYPRAAAHPVLGGVLDRGAHASTAVTQQRHEQAVAALEVMVNARIGHAHALGDGTYLDRAWTAFDQQFLSGLED